MLIKTCSWLYRGYWNYSANGCVGNVNIKQLLLRQSLSQTHSYNTLAIYLKLFTQFECLRSYFFKAQIAQTQIVLYNLHATQIAQP